MAVKLVPTPVVVQKGTTHSFVVNGDLELSITFNDPSRAASSKRYWFTVRNLNNPGDKTAPKKWTQAAAILSKYVAHVHFEENKR